MTNKGNESSLPFKGIKVFVNDFGNWDTSINELQFEEHPLIGITQIANMVYVITDICKYDLQVSKKGLHWELIPDGILIHHNCNHSRYSEWETYSELWYIMEFINQKDEMQKIPLEFILKRKRILEGDEW